jgi:hypothetical protein
MTWARSANPSREGSTEIGQQSLKNLRNLRNLRIPLFFPFQGPGDTWLNQFLNGDPS